MVVAHDVSDACLHSRDGIVGGADSETPASRLEAETSAPSAPIRSSRGGTSRAASLRSTAATNLKHSAAADIFADLVRNADIVVHNVIGGTAERLAVMGRTDPLEDRCFSTQEGRLLGRRAEQLTQLRAEGAI